MADYWLIRRARVDVSDLYTESADGEYHFTRDFNLRAVGPGRRHHRGGGQ